MEDSIDKIQLKGIDKANRETFRFDEIAFNINERVEPTETNLEIYVGLEHLNPESIHLKRFGKRDDVKGTKLRVYPGDIIFGRRRAYQRKAAIANFDGFCSAHALVLRANYDVIDPKLFPFFLHSDTFMHRAVDISVGSLSPTINWGTLKKQEFLLPPKEQQARIADLLWAADDMVEEYTQLKVVLNSYRDSYFNSRLESLPAGNIKLKDILVLKKEKSFPPHNGKKYIGLENIESGFFYCTNYQDSSSVKAQCNIVNKGDLCYSKLRPYLDKAFIASFEAISTTELLIFEIKNDFDKEYILHHFHSKKFVDYVSNQGFGTKMPRVSFEIIGDYDIKDLDRVEQLKLLKELKIIRNTIDKGSYTIENIHNLRKSIINKIF